MHAECHAYVERALRRVCPVGDVLEIGGRDVNGSIRDTVLSLHGLEGARYTSIDLIAGPGVDVVADGATYGADAAYDLVICTEVLEHAPNARGIVANAHRVLRPGGALILTAAWEGRAPHSGHDGGPLRMSERRYRRTGRDPEPRMLEYYANVRAEDLVAWLRPFARWAMEVDDGPRDIRCTAWK